MGSVPNCRKEITNRYPIRWFKCKLKPPKKNNLAAQLVRGQILGLPEGQNPTQEEIDGSELFTLRPPQEDTKEEGPKAKMMHVHSYWLPFLHEKDALGDCPLEEFQPPPQWPKIYTAEGLREHVPEAVAKWVMTPSRASLRS